MKYQNKNYHTLDKLLKASSKTIQLIFKECEIEEEIVEVLPTEYQYKFNTYHLDYLCKTSDGVLRNIEFQSTKISKEDIKRFMTYGIVVNFEKYACVETLIIATYPTKNKTYNYRINKDTIYKVRLISLKNFDGDSRLERIENKIKNKEKITKEDVHDIVLLPLMNSIHSPQDILVKTIYLANKCITSKKCLLHIKSLQPLLVAKLFKDDEKEMKRLFDVIDMRIRYFEEKIEEGIKQGIEQGLEQGKTQGKEEQLFEVYKNLSEKFTLDEIAELLKKDKKELQAIITKIN